MASRIRNDKLKSRIKQTLLEIIEIESEHPNEDEIAEYITLRLKQNGVAHQTDGFGNIIAKVPGAGKPLLLSTHIDIPEAIPDIGYLIEGDIISSNGNGILGVDPKSGLAVLLELVCGKAGNDDSGNHSALEIVLTRGEEKGLLGAKNLDYSLIESEIGLVLDEDGPVENVVAQAPACVYLDAVFTGKAAHPREPEKSNNALAAAHEAIRDLPWGFTANGVMWNIGTMQAGTARNTVPGSVEIQGELRGHDPKLALSDANDIKNIFKKEARRHGVNCEVELIAEKQGYAHDRHTPVIRMLEYAYQETGRTPNYYSTLGRSDANIFNSRGISTAAIGSGYYNAHQYCEYADLQDMLEIHEFIRSFDKVHAEQTCRDISRQSSLIHGRAISKS